MTSINLSDIIFTNVLIPGWGAFSANNLFDEEDEDLLAIEIPEKPILEDLLCICDMNTLIGKGCRCGAMQRELEKEANQSP